jgi:RNA recognition motif-containing protein
LKSDADRLSGVSAAVIIVWYRFEKGYEMNIYVGNLPFKVREEELTELFQEFGELASVNVVKDRHSGQSKGFGFVDMPNNSEADQAIKALNGKFIDGRNIKVNPADPGGKKKTKKRRY